MVELAERDGFAGRRGPAFFGVLADYLEHAGDAACFVLRRVERRAIGHLAGKNARHRHLAAVRSVEGLEHHGHRLIAGLHAHARGRLRNAGRFMPQCFEETQHAIGARRDAHQHRADTAVAQVLGEIIEYLVARRLDIFEQLLHQPVVVIGEFLQHGEARLFLAIEVFAPQLDDLRGGVFLVNIGALEREIDET